MLGIYIVTFKDAGKKWIRCHVIIVSISEAQRWTSGQVVSMQTEWMPWRPCSCFMMSQREERIKNPECLATHTHKNKEKLKYCYKKLVLQIIHWDLVAKDSFEAEKSWDISCFSKHTLDGSFFYNQTAHPQKGHLALWKFMKSFTQTRVNTASK